MEFSIKSESYSYEGYIYDCITFLQNKNVMLAIHVEETGLNYCMMRLNVSESLSTEDDDSKEINITRIS